MAYKKYISLFLEFYRNIMAFTKHYPEVSDFKEKSSVCSGENAMEDFRKLSKEYKEKCLVCQ